MCIYIYIHNMIRSFRVANSPSWCAFWFDLLSLHGGTASSHGQHSPFVLVVSPSNEPRTKLSHLLSQMPSGHGGKKKNTKNQHFSVGYIQASRNRYPCPQKSRKTVHRARESWRMPRPQSPRKGDGSGSVSCVLGFQRCFVG